MKIRIDNIIIGERQRIDLGDPLNDLASIGDPEVGLINPITVEHIPEHAAQPYRLLAGRRRLEWHIRSGKTEIEATIRGQSTELVRQKIELLEDIERKDRSWQEECLAYYKLHNLIRLEKQSRNESWSGRAMARFTGLDKNIIAYSLEIGRMLKAEPRDDEMWKASNFSEALKLVIDRNYKDANDELEKRRQVWQQREAAARAVTEPTKVFQQEYELEFTEESPTPEFASALGDVPIQDTTPPRTKVFIHGLNMAFEDAVPDVHFMAGRAETILGWAEQPQYKNIIAAIAENGLGILWCKEDLAIAPCDMARGDSILWNQISLGAEQTKWPFARNYWFGMVVAKNEPTNNHPNPSGSVISCLPDGDELPYPVVEWCLRVIARDNSAVLCPCNAPVLAVAMTGRIPIWFEADKTKFDEKVLALKNYYLDNVPNCDLYIRVFKDGELTSEPLV